MRNMLVRLGDAIGTMLITSTILLGMAEMAGLGINHTVEVLIDPNNAFTVKAYKAIKEALTENEEE